jgi:hypothetical protein
MGGRRRASHGEGILLIAGVLFALGIRLASMTSIVSGDRVLRCIRRNYDDNLRETEGGVGILPGIVIPDITLGLKGMRASRPLFWAPV